LFGKYKREKEEKEEDRRKKRNLTFHSQRNLVQETQTFLEEERILHKIVILQSWTRGHLARRRLRSIGK
jgi:hypothetical protein